MAKRYLLPLVLILIGSFFFFKHYGRGVYVPLLKKGSKPESVSSVLEKIEQPVYKRLQKDLEHVGLDHFPAKISLLAFKEEELLQVYVHHQGKVKLLKEFPFTAMSGDLGPKLKQGDLQIPEGIYRIQYLNPNSSYYLSMRVNYPNEFDKSKTKLSSVKAMGGDIFIHGKAVTIGCIPIGDKGIEELFVLVQKAQKNGVRVIISPRDFRKNSTYPDIPSIEWEDELYKKIDKSLGEYSTP